MRYWLIILFFLGAIWSLQAQTYLGVKFGGHLTTINYDAKPGQPIYEMDQKIRYMGGLVFQKFANRNFALQIEIAYVQKGWKTAEDTLIFTQYERNIDYIDIPILTHASFGSENIEFFLQLGFFTGYALSSSEIFYDPGGSIEKEYVYDPDRDNRFEYGLQGGAGFKRHFGFGVIQLEGNFIFTLNSVYKWGYESTDTDFLHYFDVPEQAQNQLIQFTLSYLYPIKK